MAEGREISSVAALVVVAREDLRAVTAGLSTNPVALAEISTAAHAHRVPATDVMIVVVVVAVAIARIVEIASMAVVVAMTAVAVMVTDRASSSRQRPWWDSMCRWNLRPRPRKPWQR